MNTNTKLKTFITEVKRDEVIKLFTGSHKDFVQIIFEGMTSKNTMRIVFKISENITVSKED